MKKVFNEHDGAELEVRFKGTSPDGVPGAPAVPQTAYWRLDCATTGQSLREWTAVTPVVVMDETGTSVAKCYVRIDVPSELNVIQNARNSREDKVLMVAADKDAPREKNDQLVYSIKNTRQRV